MKRLLVTLFTLSLFIPAFAQFPGGKGGMGGAMMNIGHFYGKVIDSLTGKPVEFASVQLWGDKWDSTQKQLVNGIVAGMITPSNGDFSLENLAVMGKFSLHITFVGYRPYQQDISFSLDFGNMKPGKDPSSMINAVDKDLGNIMLVPDPNVLKDVAVDGNTPILDLKFDKKVFNVEKSAVTAGGTAQDVLKTVPSVNVDIDGNVTMRNASPQIFVDGKPTTLSLDQIPADAIESVEIISNPSAKYDASGGQAGILNIVLKKNRRMGYNGDVRAGVDSRGKINVGGDINSRQKKTNLFLSAMVHQRNSVMDGLTIRNNLSGYPLSNITQSDHSTSNGYFAFVRGGFDWLMDNRNTLTFSGNYVAGSFKPEDSLHAQTDLLYPSGTVSSLYNKSSSTPRLFTNEGGSVQYKHLFPKADKELTAEINLNNSSFQSTGNYRTQYSDLNANPVGAAILQKQDGTGINQILTLQTDYANPITKTIKIEAGLYGSVKYFKNHSNNYEDLTGTGEGYVLLSGLDANYTFLDQVYAGYTTFSQQIKKFSYQLGLRVESSFYSGELLESGQKVYNQYPLSLFPSGSATYDISDNDNFQFSYSRRINRPSFFQMLPYTDYTDSLNLSRGNPALRPEFTNSLELAYLKTFDRNNSVLASLWYKGTDRLITRYQVSEYDSVLNREVIINTYENANSSYAYGLELTLSNGIKKWFSSMIDVNVYNSQINGTNLDADLTNQQFSYFAKLNLTFKFLQHFSYQITGDYQSKSAVPAGGRNSGGGMGYGGGMFNMGPGATVQGYNLPMYGVDMALKFDFLKNKMASITLNCADVFKTRVNESYSSSPYFIQDTRRTRDQLFFRLNFMYRFGKFDVSLLKRKDNKIDNEGMQNMGM